LLWKEAKLIEGDLSPSKEWLLAWFSLVLLVVAACVNRLFWARVDSLDIVRLAVLKASAFALVLIAIVWCWDLAFGAAACVCRERERGTLDTLLTLPVSRAAVLGVKWLGAVLASGCGHAIVFLVAMNLGIGAIPLRNSALLLCVLAVQVAFLASLGVRVSVSARTTLRAQVTMAFLLLLFFGSGWVASGVDAGARDALNDARRAVLKGKPTSMARPGVVRALVYEVGANPALSWVALSVGLPEENDILFEHRLNAAREVTIACATPVYALAAGLLWLDAWRCFRAERKGRADRLRFKRGD
jgi:hypothetical protein